MNILVTGGNGFIGQALVPALLSSGHDVSVLDIANLGIFKHHPIRSFLEVDLTREFSVREKFDCLFHLAACNVTHVGQANASNFQRVNVLGTKNLLLGVEADQFVFFSTTKVFKRIPGVIVEESEIEPQGDYANSKLQAEKICQQYFRGKILSILRINNIFGPGQSDKAIVPVFFRDALQNKPLEIFGPPDQILQLVFIEDLIRFLVGIVGSTVSGGIFNVAGDELIRLDELPLRVISMCSSKSAVLVKSQHFEGSIQISTEKTRSILQWCSSVSLNDGLEKVRKSLSAG